MEKDAVNRIFIQQYNHNSCIHNVCSWGLIVTYLGSLYMGTNVASWKMTISKPT